MGTSRRRQFDWGSGSAVSTHIAHLALLGQYVAGNFTLVSDGFGGTLVVDPPVVGSVDGALVSPLPG